MAESAESAALRAAVEQGSLLAVLTAVGDLLGELAEDACLDCLDEGNSMTDLANLFDALAFVIGELALEFDMPATSDEVKQFQKPLGHALDVLGHIHSAIQRRASDANADADCALAVDTCHKTAFKKVWGARGDQNGGTMKALFKLQDTWSQVDEDEDEDVRER